MADIKIALDAGHGGSDSGATFGGRAEKDDTLRLTKAVGSILEDNGINVFYTRTTDEYETPFKKAMDANNSGADYFVSIHRNSSETDNKYCGVESLVYNDNGIKAVMARNINAELEKVGFKNLGVDERPNLVVLKRTKMPAVLVEVGFINCDSDNALFDKNFNEIAKAIADGILKTIYPENVKKYEQSNITPVSFSSSSDFAPGALYAMPASAYGRSGPHSTSINYGYPEIEVPGSRDRNTNNNQNQNNDNNSDNDMDNDRNRNNNRDMNNDRNRNNNRDMDNDRNMNDDRDRNNDRNMNNNRDTGNDRDRNNNRNMDNYRDRNNDRDSDNYNRNRNNNYRGREDEAADRLYRVQVGSYKNKENADRMLNALLVEGFPAFILYDDGLYKVQVGAFQYMANAIKMEQRLRRFRYNTYIVFA